MRYHFPTDRGKVTFASYRLEEEYKAAWASHRARDDFDTDTWDKFKEWLRKQVEDYLINHAFEWRFGLKIWNKGSTNRRLPSMLSLSKCMIFMTISLKGTARERGSSARNSQP